MAQSNPVPAYVAVSFLVFLGASFLTLFGTRLWGKGLPADLMYRPLNFAYYFIAPFVGMGIVGSLAWLERLSLAFFKELSTRCERGLKIVFGFLLIGVFLPSCLVQAHPRWMYDSQYRPTRYDEWSINPEQQLSHAIWVTHFVEPDDKTIFAGVGDNLWARYLLAYGNLREWHENITIPSIWRLAKESGQPVYYVIDKNSLRLPGETGERLSISDLCFLNDNLTKTYDDGSLSNYAIVRQAQTS